MYPDIDSEKNQFSGKIFIYSLEGDFINGFRVKDGYFVSKFIKKNNTANKSFGNNTYNSRTVDGEGLNEVIIINSYYSPKNVITDLQLPNDWEIGGNAGSDYGMGWDYNSGGGGSTPPNDPCSTGTTTTTISQNSQYTTASTSIATASVDGKEHSITLGKDTDGQMTQSPMNNGGMNSVAVNTSWPGAFAAIHNHITDTPPSTGDIYAAITLNETSSDFTTSFINVPDGSYSIVVNNLGLAQAFVSEYPADISSGYSPEFPMKIFDEIDIIQAYHTGSSAEGKMQAVSFVLDKYNSGITILKQDSDGNFKPFKIEETINSDGSKTYTLIPCNN